MKKISFNSFVSGFSIVVGLASVLSGFGSRWGIWNFRTGFTILRISAWGGLGIVVFSLFGIVLGQRSKTRALLFIVFGMTIAAVPWNWIRTAKGAPAIHDITTDTDHPPSFVAIIPLRMGVSNSAEYGGSEVAQKQKGAYPDLGTLVMNLPVDQTFSKALQAAQKMGWKVVDFNPVEGRIEATATTFWFGFKDDVVLRVLPTQDGSKIDMRSVSRVGKGDAGTNARRIREYFRILAQA